MNDRQRLNQAIIDEFRANSGKVGGQFSAIPILLLTTIGAKSGESRISPLAYLADGDTFVVTAANGGRPKSGGWYYNLLSDPRVTIEVGDEQFAAHATVVESEERERLYARIVEAMPLFADFQAKTARQIPIIVLSRAI